MTLEGKNYCYILSFDDLNLEHQVKYDPKCPPPNTDFFVQIHANLIQVPIDIMEDEEEDCSMLIDKYETRYFYKSFKTPSQLLIREDYTSSSNISNMLSDVNVPEDAKEGMIREISYAARRIAAAKQNANRLSSLAMSVHIGVVVYMEPEDVMEYIVNNEEGGELGADKMAVDALDDVMVEDIRQGFHKIVSIAT